jgi:hypothetical protein
VSDNHNELSFWEVYEVERDKLSVLPNSDDDYIALEKAMEIKRSKNNIKGDKNE